jgi:hypothetical protein
MHRSSESIASLATALAKAQSELSNPEKSLIATIGADRPGDGPRTFRYAPLSTGLDIVRKALGQQQIATIQTTAIDSATGTINLSTVLAHASGEWIASDWPVCRIADTASPHRMGAALTYARRYALFTLVGIAGEDDLDAPDLNSKSIPSGDNAVTIPTTSSSRSESNGKAARPLLLDPASSAALRDRLVHEVAGLDSADASAEWARAALRAKNTLTASDDRLVQVAFELRLSALESDAGGSLTATEEGDTPQPRSRLPAASETRRLAVEPAKKRPSGCPSSAGRINKSVLSISEARRYRDRAHIKFVASQPCLVCGRKPCDPHHLRFAQVRALGRKVSDEFAVPLCRLHHRELHRARNEADWWSKLGIDALATALKLWKISRRLPLRRRKPLRPLRRRLAPSPRQGSSSSPNSAARGINAWRERMSPQR